VPSSFTGGPVFKFALQTPKFITRTNFPVVLLTMAGNTLVVSTTIYTDAVYVDKLLSIDLHLGSHGPDKVLRVARVFAAINKCTDTLRIQQIRLDTLQNMQPGVMYPSPTADPPEAEIPRLEFICKLDRGSGTPLAIVNEANEQHAIYLARRQTNTTGDTSGDVVLVKFTPWYNEEAHRLLADHDPPLAPALFSCNRVVGDMYMVVMEYKSDASPLHLFFPPFTPPCPLKVEVVRKSLKKALELLHGQGLVFGDLQPPNILHSHGGDCVFLVDFDWVGKHREDRYSPCLNPVVRSDVSRWQIMEKAHDIQSLEGVMEWLEKVPRV
jgi:serine/threonine protein kinase